MLSELEKLQITPEELDNLVNVGFFAELAVDTYRALRFKEPKRLLSVFFTEVFTFILILIILLPVSIILFRAYGNFSDNSVGVAPVLLFILSSSILFLGGWNIWLWQYARKNHYLAILLEKVKNYNHVIAAMIFLARLDMERKSKSQELEQQELLEILKTTKESLINALKITMMLRNYHGLINRYSELFLNLENNLTTLVAFDASQQASQYGQLLNDALQIGMSVHREIKNLKNQITYS